MENEGSNEGGDAVGLDMGTIPRHALEATRLESPQRHKGAQSRGQMVMNTIAPSTGQDDAQLARRLPPDLLRTVLAYENELQRLQAQQPTPDTAKIEAKKKRANHAGAYKVMRLEAAVLDLVHDHRPQLEKWTGSRRSRAEWAKKQIKAKEYGYVPGWRYIDNYLKTLSL